MPPSKQPKNVSDHFMFISNHDDCDEELELPEETNHIRIDESFMEEMVKDTEVSVEVPEKTDYVRIEECFMESKHAFKDGKCYMFQGPGFFFQQPTPITNQPTNLLFSGFFFQPTNTHYQPPNQVVVLWVEFTIPTCQRPKPTD